MACFCSFMRRLLDQGFRLPAAPASRVTSVDETESFLCRRTISESEASTSAGADEGGSVMGAMTSTESCRSPEYDSQSPVPSATGPPLEGLLEDPSKLMPHQVVEQGAKYDEDPEHRPVEQECLPGDSNEVNAGNCPEPSDWVDHQDAMDAEEEEGSLEDFDFDLEGLDADPATQERVPAGDELLSAKYDLANAELLGEGAQGVVSKIRRLEDGGFFALKVLQRGGSTCEASIMGRLEHPSIVRLVEAMGRSLVYELCTHGDLKEFARSRSAQVKETAVMFAELADAVSYLHSLCIAHRDIKLDNVLLRCPAGPGAIALADFSIATVLPNSLASIMEVHGTMGYLPPEARQRPYMVLPGDVWALGAVLWGLFHHARLPCETIPPTGFRLPKSQNFPRSPKVFEMLDHLLAAEPLDRDVCAALALAKAFCDEL